MNVSTFELSTVMFGNLFYAFIVLGRSENVDVSLHAQNYLATFPLFKQVVPRNTKV